MFRLYNRDEYVGTYSSEYFAIARRIEELTKQLKSLKLQLAKYPRRSHIANEIRATEAELKKLKY